MRNVLLQIAALPGAVSVQINTESGGTSTGMLSNVAQVGNGIVTLDNGTIVTLCSIAWIRLTGGANMLTFTPLPLPEPTGATCEEVCESEIRNALTVGVTYNFRAGGTTTGNRAVRLKAVGIVFVGNDTAISTCHIEEADPQ